MSLKTPDSYLNIDAFSKSVKKRSDKLMNYFLTCFFITGLILASFYDTWGIACGVGGLCLVAYYSCKIALPESDLYQYILSVILGVFMGQYIYQMHGMFEMHFFAFIGSALLITYQNWKLQLPLMLVVVIHHGTFNYLQNIGFTKIYFIEFGYFNTQTFTIHILLVAIIFFICGLWGYQLKIYTENYVGKSLEISRLQKEALILVEKKRNIEALEKSFMKAEQARGEAEAANLNARHANVGLEKKNKEMEQFAYIVSHDLQEPLRTISSFMMLLQKHYVLTMDEKAGKYFSFILEASDRMKTLIKNLLDYSRIGTKRELQQVDCQSVLMNVIADLHVAIQEVNADISFSSLPVIDGYALEIKQLFQNLLTNAIKFSKKDVSPVIVINVKNIKNGWEFTFKDNGIGIEEQHRDKIFNIFQRLHTRAEYEGTGIGLSHCKKIVELHQGNIWVNSTYGSGSTFHFTIQSKNILLQ